MRKQLLPAFAVVVVGLVEDAAPLPSTHRRREARNQVAPREDEIRSWLSAWHQFKLCNTEGYAGGIC